MDLFKSSNPVLSDKKFDSVRTHTTYSDDVMTIKGTANKFGFTALMLMAGAIYSWTAVYSGASYAFPVIIGGAIGGLIIALIITFKMNLAPYLVPAYGVLEGLVLGGISAFFNAAFAEKMPNIIINAVGLTVATAVAMFLLYKFNVIKATQRFKSIVFTATAAIAIFYLIVWVLRMFGMPLSFMHDSSPLGIGISLLIVGVAALNLIIDFDFIENRVAEGAPKYMEWFGAFGLMVTLVWLYLEILKLLARIASSRD